MKVFFVFCLLLLALSCISSQLIVEKCSPTLLQSINATQVQNEMNLFVNFATHVQEKYNLPKSLHSKFKEMLPYLFKKYQKQRTSEKVIQHLQSAVFRILLRHHNYKITDWKQWKSCISFDTHIDSSWKQLFQFFNTLYTNLHQRRLDNLRNTVGSRVVIVGSGPHGLLNAIEVYVSGIQTIKIYEKRGERYNRNVWFDIYPQPYSRGYQLLHEFGFAHQIVQYEPQTISESQKVITIRCNVLQEFLIKVLQVLNIKIYYHMEYITYCEPLIGDYQLQEKPIALFIHNTSQLKIELPR